MEALLQEIAHYIALGVELIAILAIAIGALQAVFGVLQVGFRGDDESVNRQRLIWLRFARWLVAGLTFQLAADVVNTSFDPGWEELGQLATIAVIRTFLSFFLDREMQEKSERLEHRLARGRARATRVE